MNLSVLVTLLTYGLIENVGSEAPGDSSICFEAPAVFVIGRCSLIQHLSNGILRWFRCACSASTEKPEDTKRSPRILTGSKTCQHGTPVGVSKTPTCPDIGSSLPIHLQIASAPMTVSPTH